MHSRFALIAAAAAALFVLSGCAAGVERRDDRRDDRKDRREERRDFSGLGQPGVDSFERNAASGTV